MIALFRARMGSRRWFGVAALALAALPAGGCSWLAVQGPPPNHQELPYVDCTSSNVLPTLDAIISGIGALDAVGILGASSGSSASANKADLAFVLGGAAAFAASAYYGYHRTSTCRAAQRQALARAGLQVGYPPPFAPRPVHDPWIAHPAPTSRAWEPPAPPKPVAPLPADGGSAEDAAPDAGTDAEAGQ